MPYALTLYITGQTARSERAITAVRRLCTALGHDSALQVVDVLEQPETAEQQRILATPTLVRESPPPMRRVIGDLQDEQRVAEYLGLDRIPGGEE